MNVLVVAATEMEVTPFHDYVKTQWIESSAGSFTKGNCTVNLLISGIGMHRMAFTLGRALMVSKPDFCVNAGIAGAFPNKASIGEVVHVTHEIISDLGAEDVDGNILTLDQLNLTEDISSVNGLINTQAGQYGFLRTVKGLTSNLAHGSSKSIENIVNRWDPDVASMEGAAFFYSCLKTGVSFIEIRAISNIVEPRNRDNWNIPLAVENLNAQLVGMMNFFVG